MVGIVNKMIKIILNKCFKLEFVGGQSFLSGGSRLPKKGDLVICGKLPQPKVLSCWLTRSYFHPCLKFSIGEFLDIVEDPGR
jgi:hypothetical protein